MAGLLDFAQVGGGGLLGSDPETLGLSLMANAGPSPVRQPIGSVLGNSALQAQQMSLNNMGKRIGLARDLQQFQMQQLMMQNFPAWLAAVQAQTGGGAATPAGNMQTSNAQPSVGGATPVAGGAGSPAGVGATAAPQQSASTLGASGPNPVGMMNLGLMGGFMGMPGSQQALEYGKTMLQYNPQIAQQIEAAKSALSVDLSQRDAALAKGDTQTASMWHMKALQDSKLISVSERNGNITAFTGGMDPRTGLPNFSGFNPDTGIQSSNAGASGIPGFAAAKGNIAGAEAGARAAYQPQSFINRDTGEEGVTSQLAALQSANAGRPLLTKLGPGQEGMIKENVKDAGELNDEYRKQAIAGNELLPQIATIRSAAATFTPGKFADSRAEFLNILNSAGVISKEDKERLGAYQEGTKLAIQLQAAVTKQLGSREAAQVFQYMGKSMPNLTMSADGLEKVSAYLEGVARYNITRAQYAQSKMNANDMNGVNNTQALFQNGSNPLFFIMASASPQVRQEMIAAMPAQQQAKFYKEWSDAIHIGLAPQANAYQQ